MTATSAPLVFTPGLVSADPLANYWLRQAALRLRRELCWLWQERGGTTGGALPFTERASESLDRARFYEEKIRFRDTDVAARYLTELIDESEPDPVGVVRGSFAWVANELQLDHVSRLALGMALLSCIDSAAGPIIAACHNDANRSSLTLSLMQKLWDHPEDALLLADSTHPLFRYGLLRRPEGYSEWDALLLTPELVAKRLLFPSSSPPSQLKLVRGSTSFEDLDETAFRLALRLHTDQDRLRIVPVVTPHGSSAASLLHAIGAHTGRPVMSLEGIANLAVLPVALTWCWLEGCDLAIAAVHGRFSDAIATSYGVPVTLFVDAGERGLLEGVSKRHQLSAVETPPLPFTGRLETWRTSLGPVVSDDAIAETARRFRFGAETIEDIAASLHSGTAPVTHRTLTAACRSARAADLGDLAQRVVPRFDSASQLFLPERQREHFQEVLTAMRSLTEVHYRWGTSRVWNEGGIPVLFAGPPGTGKTMAAEILASELDLPMYRVDLSQVVNKYIGETEKNLKRIFDAADVADILLLFDEADSIFGKRTEARDAHDRYANLEISYLLERMERFKGMAVLATNRKKDLDEAFLRRLRYVVDFPLPGPEQRRQIWERSIPDSVDASSLDLNMLSSRFAIAGGHIRSAVFNACLQSANGDSPKLQMEQMVIALKRELDKMNRPVALDLFGEYAPIVKRMERETDNSSE